ncbi:MAG: hypothetical protein J5I90_21605, partial [Caldilineales bacterium]|nr:hypothetical protein [Caldilineales bacterium]
LLNIKRLAYELRQPPDLARTLAPDVQGGAAEVSARSLLSESSSLDQEQLDAIVRRVLAEIRRSV